jgi:hypothetical protein
MVSGKILCSVSLVQTFQGKSDKLELVQNEVSFIVVDELLLLAGSLHLMAKVVNT